MSEFIVTHASTDDITLLGAWAGAEGWNPGLSDGAAFFPADPSGFYFGRLDGEPVTSISAIRYGTDFGFIGFYIAQPAVRGQGYGIRTWQVGMDHLAGRNVGLDGVLDQQDNYRRSGLHRAWSNVRYEGVPDAARPRDDITVIDARTVPFDQLAAYDRRFFPAARDSFLATWIGLPDRCALAAVRDGELQGFGVLRAARGASRVGPLYAATEDVALALATELAASTPGQAIAMDVPDINKSAVVLAEQLGLQPSFEAVRMYTGAVPDIDVPALYAVTSLELG